MIVVVSRARDRLIDFTRRLSLQEYTRKSQVEPLIIKYPSFLEKINQIKTVEKFTVKQAQNKMKRKQDRTEENARRLLQLDRAFKMDEETTELLLKRARAGHYVIPDQKPKDEEDVFTKEDFAKFEREYFVS